MKTLVIFYSYTGHTKPEAQRLAQMESADIAEIKDVRRPNTLKAYAMGGFAAVRGRPWPIQPLSADLSAYDRLILLSPVWAGNPPPAVNAFLRLLPKGKAVKVKMNSASGKSGCKKLVEAVIKAKGCTVEGFEDIKVK